MPVSCADKQCARLIRPCRPRPERCVYRQVIHPGLADLGWGQITSIAVIGQGAQEGEGAGDTSSVTIKGTLIFSWT